MSTIVNRATKGSPLTNDEVDANFANLNADKMAKASNLGDLADAAAARSNLGVPTVQQAADYATAMAIALG